MGISYSSKKPVGARGDASLKAIEKFRLFIVFIRELLAD